MRNIPNNDKCSVEKEIMLQKIIGKDYQININIVQKKYFKADL